jgi:hypothetical protein
VNRRFRLAEALEHRFRAIAARCRQARVIDQVKDFWKTSVRVRMRNVLGGIVKVLGGPCNVLGVIVNVLGGARKVLGMIMNVPGGSCNVLGGFRRVLAVIVNVLGGSGNVLGGIVKVLGGSGKVLGGIVKVLGGSGNVLGVIVNVLGGSGHMLVHAKFGRRHARPQHAIGVDVRVAERQAAERPPQVVER